MLGYGPIKRSKFGLAGRPRRSKRHSAPPVWDVAHPRRRRVRAPCCRIRRRHIDEGVGTPTGQVGLHLPVRPKDACATQSVARPRSGGQNRLGILPTPPAHWQAFARYGNAVQSWPFSQRVVFPSDTLMRHPETNEWVTAGFGCTLFMTRRQETFFAFLMYGVEFVVNVGGPSTRGFDEWLDEHGGISPMVERLGCRLVVEGSGRERKHYLEGSFDSRSGFDFDKRHGCVP